jgi:SAM-dependent methyltransferase
MTEDGEIWDLENLRSARRLGDWMFDQFAPFVRGDVVEVGAGIGTFSERILATPGVRELLLVEPEPACAAQLRGTVAADPRVTVAEELLPDAPSLVERAGRVDHLVCQNVLEHIDDDRAAVGAMARALRPGGVLTILVPSHPRLYGPLDEGFGHARRYTRQRLAWLAGTAGLEPIALKHFNALGILGWWAKNRLSSDPSLDTTSLRAYEQLVRLWRPIEDRLALPFGLSVILHARRPVG